VVPGQIQELQVDPVVAVVVEILEVLKVVEELVHLVKEMQVEQVGLPIKTQVQAAAEELAEQEVMVNQETQEVAPVEMG
jgi:tRNA A58 N-methylase Trm61